MVDMIAEGLGTVRLACLRFAVSYLLVVHISGWQSTWRTHCSDQLSRYFLVASYQSYNWHLVSFDRVFVGTTTVHMFCIHMYFDQADPSDTAHLIPPRISRGKERVRDCIIVSIIH